MTVLYNVPHTVCAVYSPHGPAIYVCTFIINLIHPVAGHYVLDNVIKFDSNCTTIMNLTELLSQDDV